MDSPVGAVLANIFMSYFEKKWVRTSRKRFANICAAILTFDLCLMHLVNVALPELISDEKFITQTGQFAL